MEKKILCGSLVLMALVICTALIALISLHYDEPRLGYFKEMQIKNDYLEAFDIEGKSAKDVVVDYYAGKYNGCHILMLDTECHDPEEWTEQIGEVSITYYDSNRLYAYLNGSFYTLLYAYENNLLSQKNVEKIVYRYSKSISQFAFVADKYDFQIEEVVCNIEEFYKKNNSYDYIEVIVDQKLSADDVYLDKDYFGNNVVYQVTRNRYAFLDSAYGEEYEGCREYTLHLKYDGKLYTYMAVKQLSGIPGIKRILLGGGGYHPGIDGYMLSASDPAYTEGVQWGLEDIEIERVWDFYTGTAAINVGIIDTGIYTHSDLQNNLSSGYDFYNHSESANDDVIGHGTFIAGIIGGTGNNDVGISGINWRIKMIPLQNITAIDNAGFNQNYHYDAYEPASELAIEHATATYNTNPIRILNASWGWKNAPDSLREAIANYPGLLVCSAGNDGKNLDEFEYYPQVYDLPNMIVVGAIDSNHDRSVWTIEKSSNYGNQTVDIYAPGSSIYSTYKDNEYFTDGGTSFAAPYVTGVAALLLSINPDLTTAQLKECILGGADEIEIEIPSGVLGLDTETQTVKRLNAWGAFVYMMENYTTEYTMSSGTKEITLSTNRSSVYYIEKKPTVKINIPYDEEFTFTLSGVGSSVDVSLYDAEMNEIEVTKTWKNSQWTVTFTKELSVGVYYIAVSYNNTTGGNSLSLSVSHEHTYSCYEYYSSTLHIESCGCGTFGTTKSAHVVKASTLTSGLSDCLICGHLVPTDGFGMIIKNVQKVSVNGSYILPNGIIVLVDEDVEAYLNGTLVFYDKDKVPVTQ